MRLHKHTLEMVKKATHTNTIDGEGLGMRLHRHTLEMEKAWE